MRILLVHSYYQLRGGEDAVFEAERDLLLSRGHDVRTYVVNNRLMSELSPLGAAVRTIWSFEDRARLASVLADWRPDVMHVHNTFQAMSPSVLWAASRASVPIVQTLHNFRLICPQAMLLREERICEDCVGKVPWRGVVRACYRQSHLQSAALATMVVVHRAIHTYDRHVARYIALSQFSRKKLIEGGLNGQLIDVKPNFYETSQTPTEGHRSGGLFVGRLSREKGIEVMLKAGRDHGMRGMTVIGDGPAFAEPVRAHFGAAYVGFQPLDQVMRHMQSAAFLVLPSICYENFPRTIVEAYASGLPVLASAMGAMAELVEDGVTGLLFQPGDAADLAAKVAWAHAHPAEMRHMGERAFSLYQERYRAQTNHDQLIDIYNRAIDERKPRAGNMRD